MSSSYTTSRTRTVDLDHEQLLVIDDQPGTRVQVLCGGIWLTEERRLQDRFAAAGQWLRLQAHGRAVAEALGATRVRVFEPVRRPGATWVHALRRWRPRVDVLAARSLAATLALVLGIGLPELLASSFMGHADGTPAAVTLWTGLRSGLG